MAELWDAYGAGLTPIAGRTLTRGEQIPEGVFHLVSDVIVRHADGSWLLMQRAPEKKFGLMWEATAGGSALCGETPLECARRELYEETGIRTNELIEVGRVETAPGRTIYVEFKCVTEADKNSVRLQKGETVAYRWVTTEELKAMKKAELVTERMQRFISELR
ncbi:MAG: NUDIX domain-containing protein [Clostridia bacterium]|nr:NUDIX domain-containing protein [Clostridia bacterium]